MGTILGISLMPGINGINNKIKVASPVKYMAIKSTLTDVLKPGT